MIASLEGKVKLKIENEIIVNVNGVGYLVEVADLSDFPPEGKKVFLYIYTYVREDKISLYGFKNIEERQLFEILLSVSRIGPKAAINILANLSYDSFINAVLSENISLLKEVKGIGQKTAQRLILELKSKVDDLAKNIDIEKSAEVKDNDELYDALLSLGYSGKEIDNALKNLDFEENEILEDKIKKVLSTLGKESF
ncbi:MAG: Holliday junction branch migration protein RuvA [Bacillota bacterium]